MKLCRFKRRGDAERTPRLGVMARDGIHDVTAATEQLASMRWPLPPGDQLIAHLDALRPHLAELARVAEPLGLDAVDLLSPVANPGKIVCGAGNWKHHGAPLGKMGFMFKAASALAGACEGVRIAWPHRTTLHEPELAIVVGRECKNVCVADALDCVAGYSCALDMTMQRESEDYAFCKSFDTYGVIGPCLVTTDEIGDPSTLSYRFSVNGELRGARSFADLTGSAVELVAFASSAMTLYPGDLILSGAADVAPVVPGDKMVLEIERIGRLEVAVTASGA
jgi:2-keto-4-pentenoate hydratase/2-oxohepta-3-ene-1,7-dioic acid hydratase in catechol pathway